MNVDLVKVVKKISVLGGQKNKLGAGSEKATKRSNTGNRESNLTRASVVTKRGIP